MAVYLLENEVGFDPQCIGFPSLMGCMAVVLQTDSGLFGWHSYGQGVEAINSRGPFFAQFIQEHPASVPVHLYGSCNRGERSGDTGWRAEMNAMAAILGFTGPVSGHDLTHIGHEGCYLQYDVAASRACDIYYKRQSKMLDHPRTPVSPTVQKRIVGKAVGKGTEAAPAPWQITLENLYGSGKAVTSVGVKKTFWNKGRMHKASQAQIETFTYA